MGRWFSPDALSKEFSDWSPYNYGLNNPMRFTDPDGNAPEDVLETYCCPDKSSSSLPADPMEFSSMIAGGWNSVRASVSNLFVRGWNEGADKRVDRKYEVGSIGQLVVVSGVPTETRQEKIENTIGDLATIALSATGGVQGNLMTQGGKAPVLKAVEELKSAIKSGGRSGKQERLKELAGDAKLGKADKGWIKSEMNQISNGNRKSIRNPPGKDLAHERGREAAKGYSYKHSNLQDRKLHRTQHKYDNGGRKNKERPVNNN